MAALPRLRDPVQNLIGEINLKRAAEGNKALMWTDPEKYPSVSNADMGIQAVEMDIAEELKSSKSSVLRMRDVLSYILW